MWLKIEKVMNFSEERKTLSKNISQHPAGVGQDVISRKSVVFPRGD